LAKSAKLENSFNLVSIPSQVALSIHFSALSCACIAASAKEGEAHQNHFQILS
jgi:hypothetical protein